MHSTRPGHSLAGGPGSESQCGCLAASLQPGHLHGSRAPGFAGAKCYERDAINLTKKAGDYCRAHTSEGICQYTVPWPSHQVDPGVGCFKSFSASYTCSGGGTDGDGRPDSYDILIGGNTSEAANQQVIFDCTPAKTGAKSTPLRSNGNVVSAGYSIAPDNVGRPDADGIISIGKG